MEDETDKIQLGQTKTSEFYAVSFSEVWPSAHNQYPDKFKFISVHLYLGVNKLVSNRATYDILKWLGDAGGLVDALRIIGLILTSFSTQINFDNEIVKKMFYVRSNPFVTSSQFM